MIVFRFDDVCANTNPDKLIQLIEVIHDFEPDARILLAVSPLTFDANQLPDGQKQRVHPSRLTAVSRLTPYYEMHQARLPESILRVFWTDPRFLYAGHGLVHVDHRLLSRDAQEMSIVASCHLARGHRLQQLWFVPPYNKFNDDTESICAKHEINLIKFEDDGWRHVIFNDFKPMECTRWYLHPFDIEPLKLRVWFESVHARGIKTGKVAAQ